MKDTSKPSVLREKNKARQLNSEQATSRVEKLEQAISDIFYWLNRKEPLPSLGQKAIIITSICEEVLEVKRGRKNAK